MSNPLSKHIQNAFQEFEGLHIAGTVPLREELINELLAHILRDGIPTPTATTTPQPHAVAEERVKVDPNLLLSRVKKASVKFEEGRAVIDFEVGV